MLYAKSGRIRRNQIIADSVLLGWIIVWALIGRAVYAIINTLRAPAESLGSAANGLGDRIQSADDSLPGFLQGRLDGITGGTDSLNNAANEQADSVTHIASIMGWSVALVPILLAVAIALFFRIRWIRRAHSASKLRMNDNWEELLARRAVMHQPLGSLARVSKDPLADLREGHFAKLAALEAEELGIDSSARRNAYKPNRR